MEAFSLTAVFTSVWAGDGATLSSDRAGAAVAPLSLSLSSLDWKSLPSARGAARSRARSIGGQPTRAAAEGARRSGGAAAKRRLRISRTLPRNVRSNRRTKRFDEPGDSPAALF
jgi:hypothetical protein